MIKLTPEKPPYYKNVAPIKTYKALITQTGTNNPTASILTNTTGETPILSRIGVGAYAIQFIQEIPNPEKVYATIQALEEIATIQYSTTTVLDFWTTGDDKFQNSPLLIEIHP